MATQLLVDVQGDSEDNPWRYSIPGNMVQWGQVLPTVDTQIAEGSYLRCQPAEIFSPSEFYVNLCEHWDALHAFMQQLQNAMSRLELHYDMFRRCKPRLEFLTPGLYVLVKYFGPKCARTEWHRAVVVKNPAYEDEGQGPISRSTDFDTLKTEEILKAVLTVRLIDFGTVHETGITSIRYMDREFMDFPIQAVQCQLVFQSYHVAKLDKLGHAWPRSECDRFFDLCEYRLLGVTFFKRSLVQTVPDVEEFSNGKWTVSVDIVEGRRLTTTLIDLTVLPEDPLAEANDLFDPERQQRAQRAYLARALDPSLERHPDGKFSNLIGADNHYISKFFIPWISTINTNNAVYAPHI